MNNFYNEPAFAERLLEVSQQGAVPETIQDNFVQTVVCCRVGNGYGVSNAAISYYDDIIRGFSPREVAALVRAAKDSKTRLGQRLINHANCRSNFKTVLNLIDAASVPNAVKADFDRLLDKK